MESNKRRFAYSSSDSVKWKWFVSGAQNVEYKNKVWHEECFTCFECKQPIRTQSFLTKGDDIYCATCHGKKFAKKCFHCKQVKAFVRSLWMQKYSLVQLIVYSVNDNRDLQCLRSWPECFFAPRSPSPLEASATRTSPGTLSVSCATTAVRLWGESASPPTRTMCTAWTASRATWPRSAMAARTQSQVGAARARSLFNF